MKEKTPSSPSSSTPFPSISAPPLPISASTVDNTSSSSSYGLFASKNPHPPLASKLLLKKKRDCRKNAAKSGSTVVLPERSKIHGVVLSASQCRFTSHGSESRRGEACEKTASGDACHSGQRFCVQCDRFHALTAFDEGNGICRLTLAGQYKRIKKLQPEANCVLSYGTLVYLPGKVKQCEGNGADSDSFTCEDLERTVTNEEEDSDTTTSNLRDEASSGNVKEHVESILPRITDKPENHQAAEHMDAVKKSDRKGKRASSQSSTPNLCQVEGCMIDLSDAKDYFRRRKVCEEHFRANKVQVKNLEQRFCQQCSRFHVLGEFDEGRKSCKKMLLGHNMRRRKAQSRSSQHAGTGIPLPKAQDYKSAETLVKSEETRGL